MFSIPFKMLNSGFKYHMGHNVTHVCKNVPAYVGTHSSIFVTACQHD